VPLSPERFKVTFTASRELKNKLERLQALVEGDIEAVIEAAVTEKLERLEAKRFAATKKPRKDIAASDTAPKSSSASGTARFAPGMQRFWAHLP
jgi:hypothetical protein